MNQSPTVFIRELEDTARCDQFHDFSKIRAAYHEKVGEDSMRRIASYDETEKDERRAEQAIVHYYDWTQRCLIKALTWQNWLWYPTVYKVEHTVALFTLEGGVVGGWKFVRPLFTLEGGVVGGWKFVRPWHRKWTQPAQQLQQ